MQILYQCVVSGEKLAQTIGLHNIDDIVNSQLLLKNSISIISKDSMLLVKVSTKSRILQ